MNGFQGISKLRALLLALVILFVIGGCSSTFTVGKDGRRYFFGSKADELHKMLCESGDLKRILDDTSLQKEIKGVLYKESCSFERSGERVKEIYASLSAEQRKDLRTAFKRHGYEINHMPC